MSDRRFASTSKPLTVPASIPVHVAPESLMAQITGVDFHGGILAVGQRPDPPSIPSLINEPGPCTLVVCPEITNLANLGAIIRVAAGFGVAGLILGERSSDPWFRKSVRVSMGTIFNLPIVRSSDIKADMLAMHRDMDIELVSAALVPGAIELRSADRPRRLALVMGNEELGVHPHLARLCQRTVMIPMHRGTDSLNVVVATGVMLYHFTTIAPPRP
jgi:tRNA G18 (ribose-2'-O)-methylase SpoU